MRAVNLLPRETGQTSSGFDRTVAIGVAVTVLIAAILAGSFFLEQANAASARQRLAEAQAALTSAQTQTSTHSSGQPRLQVPVVLSQQDPWHVALDSAISTRVAWDTVLRQLEYAVPDKVTLASITLGGASGGAGTASGAIAITGNAFSAKDVAVFLSILARLPKVSQVTLVSNLAGTGSPIQTFSVTAQLALPLALTAPTTTDTTATTTTGAAG